MNRKSHPSILVQPVPSQNSGVNNKKSTFLEVQPYGGGNYSAYLSTLSLGGLQKQLQSVRQKQKQFYKLNYQLKMLQKRSRVVSEESRRLSQGESELEDEEIAQLKGEIEGVNWDIKTIGEEGKVVKRQCGESRGELRRLEEELERGKAENQRILQQVNQKKGRLMKKTSIIQELKESQLQNHKSVCQLRKQIKSLEQESHLLQSELEVLREQREAKQRNREKLERIITELEGELIHQRDVERESHYRLESVKGRKDQLEGELLSLRNKEEKYILEYENKLEEYHKVSGLAGESAMKKKTLEDQLLVVQNDLKQLNAQFINEGQLLKQQQDLNIVVNEEFDLVTKEAIDVWNSICELIKIQEQEKWAEKRRAKQSDQEEEQENEENQENQEMKEAEETGNKRGKSNNNNNINSNSNKSENDNDNDNDIKFKALKVWKEIEAIINQSSNS